MVLDTRLLKVTQPRIFLLIKPLQRRFYAFGSVARRAGKTEITGVQQRPVLGTARRIPMFDLNIPLIDELMPTVQAKSFVRHKGAHYGNESAIVHLPHKEMLRDTGLCGG